MFNKICKACIHSCKQYENARILRCPRFQKRVSEKKFREMLDEMDGIDERAEELSKRAGKLVDLCNEYATISKPIK